MAEDRGDGGQGGDKEAQNTGDSNQIKVRLGDEEKVFSADDVKTLLEKSSRTEKELSQMANFKKTLARYDNIGPDDYLRNSEAAFAVMNTLIEKGVIDEEGNIIEKKASSGDGEAKKTFLQNSGVTEVDKKLGTVLKAIQGITDEVNRLKEGQTNIYRRNISADVKRIHPNLNDNDISELLAISQADKSKSFFDHAKEMSENKLIREKQQETGVAKKVVELLAKAGLVKDTSKLDLENLDLDKLASMNKEELAPVHEGKKFMFKSRQRKLKSAGEKLDDVFTPGAGMKEMLDRNLE